MARNEKSESLATNVYQQLRDRMMALEIKSGSRLIEDEISADLEVGRTPVREALLRLQGEGLLERNGGWIVKEIDDSLIAATFECRIAIEGYATRMAAERATAEDIAILRGMVERMESGGLSRIEENRENRVFHEKIVLASRNKIFHEMYERTQFPYWNLRTPFVIFTQDQKDYVSSSHRALLTAIEEHDPDRAERLAREHIEITFKIVREALM